MNEWGYQVSSERVGDMLSAQAHLNASAASASLPFAGASTLSEHDPRLQTAAGATSARLAQMPPKTQLSSTTTAGLAAVRRANANVGINPPSGANSRESSVVRRGPGGARASLGNAGGTSLGGGSDYDTSLDEESKYAGGSSSSRPSPTLRPLLGPSSSSSGGDQGREQFTRMGQQRHVQFPSQ